MSKSDQMGQLDFVFLIQIRGAQKSLVPMSWINQALSSMEIHPPKSLSDRFVACWSSGIETSRSVYCPPYVYLCERVSIIRKSFLVGNGTRASSLRVISASSINSIRSLGVKPHLSTWFMRVSVFGKTEPLFSVFR